MSRKIALPLLVAAALVSIILASRTPQPIIEELPPEEADAPTALLTQTEEVGDQTVTLRVYEPDEAGYARYALFGADGAEIDIPVGLDRGTWVGNGDAAEKVSLTAWDDVLGFPGFELETIQGIVMTVCDFYALTEQGFVYVGRAFGYDFDDAADAPAVLLTLTEKVGGQTVTLRVYELDEDGYARYALFNADGTEIDIPFGVDRRTLIGEDEAAEKVSLTARDDVLGFPGFELETVQGGRMTVRYFYALTEQGFVYAGEAFGYGFDNTEWGDGVWPLDLTGDGRSELVTRSTFGTGVPYVFVYRWNAAEGISQHSGIVWEKADAQLAKLSAPLGSVARAETYHAEDNTVTLTLYTEGGTREVTLPLTTDILGEWHAND